MSVLTDIDRALLTGDRLVVDFGCEVLDLDLTVTGDITADLLGGSIARNMDARIHGTCRLDLTVELAWGAQLVRPYMVLSDGAVSSRFECGVFMLTTPERAIEETPVFTASGVDRLYLLDREVGADYSVAAGTTYRQAILDVFTAAELSGVLIEGSAADWVLPVERTWPLVGQSTDPDQTATPATWLRIVNDLLSAINFRGCWADDSGMFRCQEYQSPSVRAPLFTFDADDQRVSIIGEQTLIADQWKAPNRWVFIRSNLLSGAPPAVEGAGIYTVVNFDDGPTSAAARGLTWTKVYSFEAASQERLVAIGDARVAADRRVAVTVKAGTGPFPAAGHYDVFALRDARHPVRLVQAVEWSYDLSGSDVSWTWEEVI